MSEQTPSEEERRDRAIERFVSVIESTAAGDLGERMDEDVSDPALAALASAYNDLVADWADRFDSVDEFGDQVVTATEQVTSRVDRAQDASQEVSDGIDEISEGVSDQHDHIQEIADEMRNLSATIEEIASSADEVVTAVDRAAARGESGRSAANEAIAELETLEDASARTVENVAELNARMDEIRDVAAFIDDVAEQTNILALNANIEASRAGEAGDGFAVVADEVKSLAEDTRSATSEIEESIGSVREQADTALEDMHQTRDNVTSGVETVQEALRALEEIVEDVEEMHVSVQEISDATDTQAESTQGVVEQVDDVDAISERTAEEAEAVATAAQRQTTSLTEIRTSITTLSERAESLQDLVHQVETDASSGGQVTSGRGREAATEVDFWHAMSGDKALLLADLASEFEAETDLDVSLDLTAKGSYRDTMTSAIAATERGEPPAITQIFEIGTKRAMDSDGFVPVEEHIPRDVVDVGSLLDPVLNYYRTDGTLYSMPFNSSNPICCYNADAFEAAGLDPDDPPETFDAVRNAAERIVDAGVADHGITFANYSWFVEQWFAEQDQELVNRRNGRDGTADETFLDSEAAHRLFEWWAGLDADGLYHNPGIEARGAATEAFHDGDAAMLIGSTSSLNGIERGAREAGFEMRTGYFPVPDERAGVLVGGGSLWLAADLPEPVRRAAGTFVGWLAQPAQQERWHRETGYFPVHEDAVTRLEADGWFDEKPHYRTAFDQLMATRQTVATSGARIGPFDTVRTMIAEAFEDMSDGAPVSERLAGLDTAVQRQLRAEET